MTENLKKLIEDQSGKSENSILFNLGKQVAEIADESDLNADLIEKDLETDGMRLKDLESHFAKYANDNHGKSSCFCITPIVADGLIRKFYGIPEREENSAEAADVGGSEPFIDLTDYL